MKKPKIAKPPNTDLHRDPESLRRLATQDATISSNNNFNSYPQNPSIGNTTTTICSICRGAELLQDFAPEYPTSEQFPSNLTCGHLEMMAQNQIPADQCESSGIRRFYTQCCESHLPVYSCERNIRQKLLGEDSAYDPDVPPIVSHKRPVDVTVRLEYQTVVGIDVQDGTTEIYFSILMYWIDPRLAWEVDEEHCADYITAHASMDPERNQLWVPDIDLYNQIKGVQQLPDTMALVYPDGLVVWHRIGGLTAFCQFTGVSQIPFDVLGCQLMMGPWIRMNQKQVKYHLWNGTGLLYGDYEATYNEYLPVPELAESGYAFGGSILFFNFFFRRSEHYYVFNLIVPTIILTYVSMGTYLLDLRVGERLSYGMALALVVVAQQIATGGMIPVSNERLWIDKFIGWSFYWVIVGLLESVFVGYLYFLREDLQSQMKSEDEERQRVIYHGMNDSVFDHNDKAPDPSTDRDSHGTVEEQIVPTSQAPQEVDVDDWYPTPVKRTVTNCTSTTSGEFYDVPLQERRTSASMTLKQQMLKAQHRKLQRTATGRVMDNDGEECESVNPCEVARSMRWMYTLSLRQMDRFFFFLTLTSYTLFLIAMFISINYWGRSVEIGWMDENTGEKLGNDLMDADSTNREQ